MSNIYYNPEASGLAIVGRLDEDDLSYEYNTLLILKHAESGKVFHCSDSGCSCPTPFEGYSFKSPEEHNLDALNKENWSSFEAAVNAFPANKSERIKLLFDVWTAL